MTPVQHALALARLDAAGTGDDKIRLKAWDRLRAQLGTLDSKTSVLLRFNAIVVAALAYVTVVRGVDPLMGSNAMMVTAGSLISHASLIASAASCGLAFPVINVDWSSGGGPAALDGAALDRLGALLARRTLLYSWAWRLAVLGGTGFSILVGLAIAH